MGVVLIGCGGDDEDGGDGANQQQTARAAQRLETYLKKADKDLKGVQTKRGQVVNDVQTIKGGKLKVFTFLNSLIPQDEEEAPKVCPLVRASDVPEARGAVVVDAGDVLLARC